MTRGGSVAVAILATLLLARLAKSVEEPLPSATPPDAAARSDEAQEGDA